MDKQTKLYLINVAGCLGFIGQLLESKGHDLAILTKLNQESIELVTNIESEDNEPKPIIS